MIFSGQLTVNQLVVPRAPGTRIFSPTESTVFIAASLRESNTRDHDWRRC